MKNKLLLLPLLLLLTLFGCGKSDPVDAFLDDFSELAAEAEKLSESINAGEINEEVMAEAVVFLGKILVVAEKNGIAMDDSMNPITDGWSEEQLVRLEKIAQRFEAIDY